MSHRGASRLYLPIGPPLCGKSALARRLVDRGTIPPEGVLDSSSFRGLLTGDPHTRRRNRDTFDLILTVCRIRLEEGQDVYLDTTNLDPTWRARVVAVCPPTCAITTILFSTPEAVVRRRNASRPHPVDEDRMASRLALAASLDPADLPGTVVSARDFHEMELAG